MPRTTRTRALVVLCTASSLKEARRLTQVLVKEKLAACVTAVPLVESVYWWKGKIERAKETLLVIKTDRAQFNALAARIRAVHSYTVPEILALPVENGNPAYLRWIVDSLKTGSKS